MASSTPEIKVCQNSRCRKRQSAALLLDIEELCASRATVADGRCMHRCMEGPNVLITRGKRRAQFISVKTFEDMKDMLEECVPGIEGDDATSLELSRLKFDLRREQNATARSRLFEKSFRLLDDKKVGSPMRAFFLALRAEFRLQSAAGSGSPTASTTAAAVADARRAVQLLADSSLTQLALAKALREAGSLEEAADAAQRAMDLVKGDRHDKALSLWLELCDGIPPDEPCEEDEEEEEPDVADNAVELDESPGNVAATTENGHCCEETKDRQHLGSSEGCKAVPKRRPVHRVSL
eukprot:TRINITY_DN30196_c0_g2_i1.p1 TRINITY_DN30196_c0_g2~~TRINITY_DN30196_c0_g2_i1.p1  ORF type:complete len:295 (-),score=78.59 TRINITY_DN30196_c0_g2_i1:251-1135(-)